MRRKAWPLPPHRKAFLDLIQDPELKRELEDAERTAEYPSRFLRPFALFTLGVSAPIALALFAYCDLGVGISLQ